MRFLIPCLILLPCSLPAPSHAQQAPDRVAILEAVDRLFQGMRARDSTLMESANHPGSTMVAVRVANGAVTVSGGPTSTTIRRIAAGSTPGPREWLLAAEVWQDGDIASVWAPYEFHTDERLSHCGYDAFNLVREGGRWQIAGAIYTVRPDGCPTIRATAARSLPLPEPTPDERRAVLSVVDGFTASLRTRDTARLLSLFSPRAQWVTAGYNDRGVTIRRRPATTDAQTLTRSTEVLDEQLHDIVVRVDGDIALVWAPYRFLIGGRLSHCGYDAFHLVRNQGTWLLEGGTYTTRPTGCSH